MNNYKKSDELSSKSVELLKSFVDVESDIKMLKNRLSELAIDFLEESTGVNTGTVLTNSRSDKSNGKTLVVMLDQWTIRDGDILWKATMMKNANAGKSRLSPDYVLGSKNKIMYDLSDWTVVKDVRNTNHEY